MSPIFDAAELLRLIKELTNPLWIGIAGSAAYASERMTSGSDLDVIVGHATESRFFYQNLAGRDVEIHQYSTTKICQTQSHPEWFGSNWAWEIGKIFEAEVLDGKRQELCVSEKSRLVAILGCLGKIEIGRKKREAGRSSEVDESRELTALRHLLNQTWPIHFDTDLDSELIEVSSVDVMKNALSNSLIQNLEEVLYFPEHHEGAKWLNCRWNLGLKVPSSGTKF